MRFSHSCQLLRELWLELGMECKVEVPFTSDYMTNSDIIELVDTCSHQTSMHRQLHACYTKKAASGVSAHVVCRGTCLLHRFHATSILTCCNPFYAYSSCRCGRTFAHRSRSCKVALPCAVSHDPLRWISVQKHCHMCCT